MNWKNYGRFSTVNSQTDHPFGFFADPDTEFPIAGIAVHAGWCVDGTRDMILDLPVLYVDPRGRRHRAPEGFRTNGLTVLRVLWRLCWPFEPLSRDASVVHDWLCYSGHDWNDAAWVFWCAMKCRGIGPFAAWIRWVPVRFVGKWFYRRVR